MPRRDDLHPAAGGPGSYNSDIARYGPAEPDDLRRYRPEREAPRPPSGFGDQEFHGYAGQEYGLESRDARDRPPSLIDYVRRQGRARARHGQAEMSWGGQGGGYGGAGPRGASIADPDPASPPREPAGGGFDPDYLAWRDLQLRRHDEAYARWRETQRRHYDEDYRAWRDRRRPRDR